MHHSVRFSIIVAVPWKFIGKEGREELDMM